MSAPKQGVMALAIKDKETLHASYMPFLKGGGIFVPTDKPFELGDEVFLLLSLLEEPQRYPVTGKVVWISNKAGFGRRPAGIGLQFSGIEGDNVQKKIETYLAGYLKAEQPTYSM